MTQSQSDISIFGKGQDSIGPMHRFSHEAMATVFEIIVVHPSGEYARRAAQAAFIELDRLEGELSRFIENSDISRLGTQPADQPLQVGLAAFECLQQAEKIYNETGGAFDITVGSLVDSISGQEAAPSTAVEDLMDSNCWRSAGHLLELNERRLTVTWLTDSAVTGPVKTDLGGIGKGYAVDRMGRLLRDWSIDTALVHSGGSSVLVLDAPAGTKGFPITLSNPANREQILAHLYLQNQALSGSGLQKGGHIVDPRTAQPVKGRLAAWSCACNATVADALSTAFMIMSGDEIEQYCLGHPDVLAVVVLQGLGGGYRILRYGPWETDDLNEQ